MGKELRLGYEFESKLTRRVDDLCCIDFLEDMNGQVRYGYLQKLICNARIVFQIIEWENIRLSGEYLVHIIVSTSPPMSRAVWSIKALESAFCSRHTNPLWTLRKCPLHLFLSFFPRTFDLIGSQSVRLRHLQTHRILDSRDEVIRSLAVSILHVHENVHAKMHAFRLLILADN